VTARLCASPPGESEEAQAQGALLQIAAESALEKAPAIYEGFKCYQFEIDITRRMTKQASQQPQAKDSFFGGFLKKISWN
jgi:hypothetical protein